MADLEVRLQFEVLPRGRVLHAIARGLLRVHALFGGEECPRWLFSLGWRIHFVGRD